MDDKKRSDGLVDEQNRSFITIEKINDVANGLSCRTERDTAISCSDCVPEANRINGNTGNTGSCICAPREKLRRLSRKTMAVLENDRKIMAREIHDIMGGSLAAIKFRIEDILSKNGDNMEIAEPLSKTVEDIQETIKKTKFISAGLRPTILDELGLEATIKWYCRQFKDTAPEVAFVIAIDIDEASVDEPQKIVLYRIIAEAMTNAVKHSGADTIWLTLRQIDTRIDLEIQDNGCGFATDDPASKQLFENAGYGLTGIKEKTEICGGLFSIESEKNRGTRLYVSLPGENGII